MPKLLFDLGETFATPGALAEVGRSGDSLLLLLLRHRSGDGGALDAHDQQSNRDALHTGARILSAYVLKSGARLWILTEATNEAGERWCTTALLPAEY